MSGLLKMVSHRNQHRQRNGRVTTKRSPLKGSRMRVGGVEDTAS